MQNANDRIDELEVALLNSELVDSPVKHHFWGGFYIRQIFMPKSTVEGKEHIIVSRIHNTTHAFYVSKGIVKVVSENDGFQYIEAPYWGITTPNTRRVLHIVEDCTWATFHPTSIVPENDTKEALEEAAKRVGEEILAKYENKLIKGHCVNNLVIPENKEINY